MDKTECPWKEELLELIDIYYYIYLQVRFVGLKETFYLRECFPLWFERQDCKALFCPPAVKYVICCTAGLDMLNIIATNMSPYSSLEKSKMAKRGNLVLIVAFSYCFYYIVIQAIHLIYKLLNLSLDF